MCSHDAKIYIYIYIYIYICPRLLIINMLRLLAKSSVASPPFGIVIESDVLKSDKASDLGWIN